MKLSSAAAYALAALLALTAQTPSPGAPPVVVNWCAFSPYTLAPFGASGQLPLRFTVTGNTTVDDIRFRLLWADKTFSPVDDAGRFAPGSEVHHTLSFDSYGNVGGEMLQWVDLQIDSVHLTNGTTWIAPLSGGPAVRCQKYFGI